MFISEKPSACTCPPAPQADTRSRREVAALALRLGDVPAGSTPLIPLRRYQSCRKFRTAVSRQT